MALIVFALFDVVDLHTMVALRGKEKAAFVIKIK